MTNIHKMKRILAFALACSLSIVANSQDTVNIAEIIHINRLDEAENGLFNDVRNKIAELKIWSFESIPDTIYAIESFDIEAGTFTLMYWDCDKMVAVSQDNMGDSLITYSRRAFSKRIIALVEVWDLEKIRHCSGRATSQNKLYATRIILNEDKTIVNTFCFPELFFKEDHEDSLELFKLWHPSNK